MPTVTTNYFRDQLAKGNINLSGDTYFVSLMDEFVTTAISTIDQLKAQSAWGDISAAHENSAANYSAAEIVGVPISTTTGNIVKWDGADITWSSVTLSAAGHCLYRSDGLIVGFVEYSSIADAVNGDITIQWNAGGIMNIT